MTDKITSTTTHVRDVDDRLWDRDPLDPQHWTTNIVTTAGVSVIDSSTDNLIAEFGPLRSVSAS